MNDELEFIREVGDGDHLVCDPWHILVIDDDIDVHQTTALALTTAMIYGRPVKLLHSYSSPEAIDLMKSVRHIDLLLVDMVMETRNAGWDVVRWVREDAVLPVAPVIILRTGQPGVFTFNDVEKNRYIDAVLKKQEVTRRVLIELLTNVLRNKD